MTLIAAPEKIVDKKRHWLPAKVSSAIFGQERLMRLNIQHTFLSFSIYLIWMIVEAVCAYRGLVSWHNVLLMYGFNIFGIVIFYVQIRSGLSARMEDSGLVLAQSIYGTAAMMLAYILIPETRAAALQTLCITIVFGMLTMRPKALIISCACMIAMLLASIAFIIRFHPTRIDVKQETIDIAVACVVLPALTSIAHHFALLRESLYSRHLQLKSALNRVHELATRDALTHLINRAYMQEILARETVRHERLGAVFSIALLDIDYFKSINDQYGHQVGDEVLVRFAKQAEAIQRTSDIIARWGGEEFLIFMPQTTCESALPALERLRATIAESHFSTSINPLTVTTSIGVAQWRSSEPLTQTLERADRALYEAKDGGRNRTVLSTDK